MQSTPNNYLKLKDSAKFSSAPYVWERTKGRKHIVVIGTDHLLDPRSPMYRRMAAIFDRVQPQFILHESVAPDDLSTETRDQAIRRGADLGFTVQLARQLGIPTESGDAPAREEMNELLARHSASEVFVYLVSTRLVGSYRNPDLSEDAAEYPAFFDSQIIGNGVPVQEGWETWDGFLREYRRVAGRSLASKTWDPQLLDPTLNTSKLNEVARTSDALRDQFLLAAIRTSLQRYDRVIVVFGSAHVVELEPSLEEMLKNQH
ncbi:hypothetical protein [Dyella terrae]|uniref:hypothetical protein n=1 Tax=Dyella terrae TaxID=522259 RepID=UPI001EFC4286|nr:hypothetical protein [Dyella terrae]ULU26803.1 hypothetical protein DYST_03751 [Dyella terrae]